MVFDTIKCQLKTTTTTTTKQNKQTQKTPTNQPTHKQTLYGYDSNETPKIMRTIVLSQFDK